MRAIQKIHHQLWQQLGLNPRPPKKLRQQAFTTVLTEVVSNGRRLFLTRAPVNQRCVLLARGWERRKQRRRWLEVFWLNYQHATERQRRESSAAILPDPVPRHPMRWERENRAPEGLHFEVSSRQQTP